MPIPLILSGMPIQALGGMVPPVFLFSISVSVTNKGLFLRMTSIARPSVSGSLIFPIEMDLFGLLRIAIPLRIVKTNFSCFCLLATTHFRYCAVK